MLHDESRVLTCTALHVGGALVPRDVAAALLPSILDPCMMSARAPCACSRCAVACGGAPVSSVLAMPDIAAIIFTASAADMV